MKTPTENTINSQVKSPQVGPQTAITPLDAKASQTPVDFQSFSDKKLFALCRKYGTQTLLWRQKFIGLLPEVHRRRLYEKRGFGSTFELGKKMAGLSEDMIRTALNLEKRFDDKPDLHEALVKGQVSIHKLSRIVAVATVENQEALAHSAKNLSKASLDVLAKDIKTGQAGGASGGAGVGLGGDSDVGAGGARGGLDANGQPTGPDFRRQNGLFEPQIEVKSPPQEYFLLGRAPRQGVPVQTSEGLELSEEVIERLNKLKKKGIDINKMLIEMLESREVGIVEEKREISEEEIGKAKKRREEGKKPARHLGVKVKRVLEKEFGTKCAAPNCAAPNCAKEAVHIHHTARFALTGNNDPMFLAPLCKAHHDVAHLIDVKVLKKKFGGEAFGEEV